MSCSSSDTHVYEEGKFFGCYLLRSLNERYKGRTYIGFTVNPNRRIKQHNSGYLKGGAKRTSGKGPWEMILIVHGFPNEISALRFEWAWTYPEKSLRLKHLVPKTKNYSFLFKFNVVCEMLRIGPWCRLPLTIRWLRQEYKVEFPLNKLPPEHMPIEFGLVQIIPNKQKQKQKKASSTSGNNEISSQSSSGMIQQSQMQLSQSQSSSSSRTGENCFICKQNILKTSLEVFAKNLASMKCLNCLSTFHTVCLANHFLGSESIGQQLLPIGGDCAKCKVNLIWGDLIQFRAGNYTFVDGTTATGLGDEYEISDEDSDEFVEKDDDDEEEDDEDIDFEDRD